MGSGNGIYLRAHEPKSDSVAQLRDVGHDDLPPFHLDQTSLLQRKQGSPEGRAASQRPRE